VSEKIKVVMAGTGGYGAYYLEELFHKQEKGDVMITGAVDPYSRRSIQYQRMRDKGIPVFSRLEEYFERHSCDLAVISSPIHFHAAQTCEALRNQSHVLCDKPLCALVRDAHSIIRCRDLSGRRVLVGYQWSYSQAVRELKTDILNGVWGAPLRLKTICLWPRGREYYNRNDWAGRRLGLGQPRP
jgi:predicted dehydrogenase